MKNGKKYGLILLIGLVLLTFTGCIPGDGKATVENPAGFFWGIWHGCIAPISLIGKLFNSNLSIFEANNTGWWYELGVFIAITGGSGITIKLGGKRKRK